MKWVFFDFDGLLADTEPWQMKAYDMAFEQLGIPAKTDPTTWVGRPSRESIQHIIDKTGTHIPLEKIRETRREILHELLKNAALMPHALDVLSRLRKKYRLGLITSSGEKEVGILFDKFRLREFFKIAVFWQKDLKPKPHPDMYKKALALACTQAENTLVLEDSQPGIQAAQSAGIYCIAIPNQYTRNQDLTQADQLAKNLLDAEEKINTHFQNIRL